ncbi:MAG: tetratricopeptide repeat protein, partial [Hypericibacter sp.]
MSASPIETGTIEDALALHRAGTLDSAEAAYRKLLERQPGHIDALGGLGVLLYQTGRREDAVAPLERATAGAPQDAQLQINLGAVYASLRRFDEAIACFKLGLQRGSQHADGWCNLAKALMALRRLDEAKEALDRLETLVPGDGGLPKLREQWLQRMGEAVDSYRASLLREPRRAEVWNQLIAALRSLNRHREAEEAFETLHRLLIEESPSLAEAHRLRGMALLALGRLREGYEEYEWRWRTEAFARRGRRIVAPFWEGEPIAGRRLLLQWEQGLGDSIHYLRFAPAVAALGAHLVAELQAPLVRLARSMPAFERIAAAGEALPPIDFQISLISLPHRLGITLETIPALIPYLTAPEADRRRWAGRLAPLPRPRIGLVWRGSPTFVNDARRSMPLAALSKVLARGRGATWIALQKDATAAEMDLPGSGVRLLDPAADLGA